MPSARSGRRRRSTSIRLVSTDSDLSIAQDFLKRRKLKHLRATRRADTVTLVAGEADDPWP
jgi:hypothetical protein